MFEVVALFARSVEVEQVALDQVKKRIRSLKYLFEKKNARLSRFVLARVHVGEALVVASKK